MENIRLTQQMLMQEITGRINYVINDNRSFLYSKIKLSLGSEQLSHEVGGGNFLMTYGIFAALNLSSKVLAIVDQKGEWDIKSNRIKCNGVDVSEGRCFVYLYSETKDQINWGIDTEEQAKSFWDMYRNSLSHVAIPKGGVAACSPEQMKGIDFDSLIRNLANNQHAKIYGLNGKNANGELVQAITAELFNEKLSVISKLINNKIQKCTDLNLLENIKEMIY